MKKILLPLLFVLFLLPLAVMGQCGSGLSVIDADGNSYATVKVGSYCWMQSNLKTRVPGSSIYRADMYPDTSANLDIYGRLYNWYAAMNIQPGETPVVSEHGFVQGVCPSGWHLPTADEISQLATFSVPGLHDTHYWMVPGTNTTAYTMRPGGYYNANRNRSEDLCGSSYMWTAQSLDESSPSIVWSDCHCDHFVVDESAAGNGLSVRCVLGVFQANVATLEASNVKSNSADLNGVVTSAGLDENYTRGFVYGTDSEHLTVDTAQTGQSEEGTYSFTINDLAENTTYHFRAYVVNAFDTAYGEWMEFTTTVMKVQTLPINDITMHTAKANGAVTDMGNYESLNAGFLYGTEPNALTDTAQREEAITAMGNYDCVLNGLLSDTKYYYCAYLTNGRQTVYGDTLDFTTTHMEVETAAATDVTNSGATLNGTLTALKGYSDNICGVVFRYGRRKDMLNHYSGGSTMDGPGDINNSVSNLSPNTTYYFQALAIHGTDTVWAADTLSFTTPTIPCPGAVRTNEHATELGSIDSVRDVEGNSYATVLIGSQCWMAQNLRTTQYADGTTPISLGFDTSTSTAYRYFPDGDTNNVATYGHLYNWKAVMGSSTSSNNIPSGVQGICPDGWHVPSDAEWTQLTDYVNSQSGYKCGGTDTKIAKALASATGWNTSTETCAVGNDPSSNNATGFSAVPAGSYSGSSSNFGNTAYFWSAAQYNSGSTNSSAWSRFLGCNGALVINISNSKNFGFSVRCVRDPLTATTDSVKEVTNNSATLYGNVKSLGKYTTVKAGFRYGTSASTMTNIVSDEVAMMAAGQFSYGITGLTANTKYYYKAFAANGTDTVYGEVKNFKTLSINPCPNAATVTDVDNNVYNTVQIGNQCWMAENLRTTKYANGTAIANGGTTSSITTAYRYFPGGDTNNVATYGHLYNWKAVMGTSTSSKANPSGVQGICPDGWHVPSDAEWTQLTAYVKSQSGYKCNVSPDNIAKALASATGWCGSPDYCDVGNDQSSNNATGFSAVPAGSYNGSRSGFDGVGGNAYFWSATRRRIYAYYRSINYSDEYVTCDDHFRDNGYSVRCLRDPLTVVTTAVSSITANSAICGGNVLADGGSAVTARGVCWSTSQNPTTADGHTTDGSGTGSFNSSIMGLSGSTTYYVRAYATNGTDTVYGEVKNFTTAAAAFSCGTDSVKDIDNNWYHTVQIGNQCWMKENLRTTKYADGTPISLGNSKSTSTAYRYYPNNDSNTVSTYGYLYNWRAAMRSSSSSENNPSGVQGICPTGWHLPSDAEWTQLTDYVSSQSQYRCNGNASFISKSLAATSGWRRDDFACAIGNYQFLNNATDFSGVPSGDYSGDYALFANSAYFWSTTLNFNDSNSAYIRLLYYNSESVFRNYNPIDFGFGVRCLRN